jgi:cytochrome c oxidase assembly protein subunit 15
VIVLGSLALLLWSRTRSRAAQVLIVVIAAQAGVGYTQYFTGVPALLVGVHIVGAISVWCAAVHVTQALRTPVRLSDDARSLARTG